jgi:hypothetical protein
MKHNCWLISLLLLLAPLTGLSALSDVVGKISYVDMAADAKNRQAAMVTFYRTGSTKPMVDDEIIEGMAVQNFDRIKTGANSWVKITINNPKIGIENTELTIRPNTDVSIDITSLKKTAAGGVELLGGSVAMKVGVLTGTKLEVRTGSAIMGVRGTEFEVSMAATGDILVTTSETQGAGVECATSLKTLFSRPGVVVKGSFADPRQEDWSDFPVPVEQLDAYRSKWYTERIEAFRADPDRATAQFAQLYLTKRNQFYQAYVGLFGGSVPKKDSPFYKSHNDAFKGANVAGHHDLIQKWISEDLAGNTGNRVAVLKELKTVYPSLKDLRIITELFERAYLRLIQLDALYGQAYEGHPKGLPMKGQIPGLNLGIEAFYKQFRAERADLAAMFQDIQYVTKLYAKRNGGDFPLRQATSADMLSEDALDLN